MEKEYVKIRSDKTLQGMPELYRASWDIRHDDETRDFCAQHDNWLIKRDTAPPEYDHETQYVTSYYEEEDGYAVQKWEVHDREAVSEEQQDE